MSKMYSARVRRFRMGVYGNRGRISAGTQVLLLRLSDDMNANAIVSIPRSQLAAEFHCPPSRITEWIKIARGAGFISDVRRGRPGVTAVYQGLYVLPAEANQDDRARREGCGKTMVDEVRGSVLLSAGPWYAQHPTQEVDRIHDQAGAVPQDVAEEQRRTNNEGGVSCGEILPPPLPAVEESRADSDDRGTVDRACRQAAA